MCSKEQNSSSDKSWWRVQISGILCHGKRWYESKKEQTWQTTNVLFLQGKKVVMTKFCRVHCIWPDKWLVKLGKVDLTSQVTITCTEPTKPTSILMQSVAFKYNQRRSCCAVHFLLWDRVGAQTCSEAWIKILSLSSKLQAPSFAAQAYQLLPR